MISEIENIQDNTTSMSHSDTTSRNAEFQLEIEKLNRLKWMQEKYTDILVKSTQKYQDKLLHPVSGAFDRLYRITESFTVVAASLYDAFIRKLTEFGKSILESYSKGMSDAEIVARLITAPGSYIFYWFLKKWRFRYKTPLLAEGVHLLVATMGGGKSSLMFDVIEELRRTTGFGSSVNTALENTKYNPITNSYFRYHDHFEMFDKFGLEDVVMKDGEVRVIATLREQFDPNFLAALVFDEFISSLNRRNNKTTDYNKVFLAIFNLVLHKRHVAKDDLGNGIKRIYFLQQIDALDGLLDASIDYKHHIEVDLDCTYGQWLLTGMLTKNILGWKVWSYALDKKRNMKKKADLWKLKQHYYRPRTFDIEDFESRNMGDFYNSLPKQKTKYNVEVKKEGIRWT